MAPMAGTPGAVAVILAALQGTKHASRGVIEILMLHALMTASGNAGRGLKH